MRKLHWSLIKRLNYLRRDASLVRRHGRFWLLDKDNWIDNRLLSGRQYEEKQIQRCMDAISEFRISRFIDIGANFGYYSIILGSLQSISEVHSIEPLSRNYHQLCGNIFANRLDKKIYPHQIGFSDMEREAAAYFDPRSTGLARLSIAEAQRDVAVFSDQETVKLFPFDSYFSFRDGRFLVKIDTEGQEYNILKTMNQFIDLNHVFFQIEVSPENLDDVNKFFAERDWIHHGNEDNDYYFCNIRRV